jgi:hypothetical protein
MTASTLPPRLQRKLQRHWWSLRSLRRRGAIRRHLRRRGSAGARFTAYPELLLALQAFNKDFLLRRSLQPFLTAGLRHMLVFADGCCDGTASLAHRLLPGAHHLVIAANDRHEVRNNRLALDLARHQGCRFLLLLQDDDLYPPGLDWLDYGLELFQQDPRLLVVGFNTGLDFLHLEPAADSYLTTPLRSRPDVHADAVGIDGAFLAIRHGLPPHPPRLRHRYCQVVCRAPLLIRVQPFAEQGGIDPRFAPFQDDDTHFCLRSWSLGHRCALVQGLPVRRDMGIGGMRLMGHISQSRAAHTLANIRLVHAEFGQAINNGSIQTAVDAANREAGLPVGPQL